MVKLIDLIKEEKIKPSKEIKTVFTTPDHENQEASEPDRIYERVLQYVEKVKEIVKGNGKFDPNEGMRIIENIVQSPAILEALYQKALQVRDMKDAFLYHSLNTAIFSIKMGFALNYNQEQLVKLGSAALLHEIGISRLPEIIIYKNSALTEEEFQILKKHPRFGYEIIMEQGKEFEWLAEIIYQEHERERGQGYPRGLKGDEIHEFSKIIGIVDIYEALINTRPQRKRFLPYTAVKMIIGTQKRYFSPQIIKALLSQLFVFPLNCWVKLNNNMIGKVIETNEKQPLRPKVEVWYDAKGNKLDEGKVISLADSPLLYITDPLYEEELPT
jgi:HD-GYP domain-containing protein (c-di-GMP phosphodiesterase class II)